MSPTAPGPKAPRITLRAETEADESLVRLIYAGTREEELALAPWSEAQKAGFLDQQFRAQRHAYQTNYPGAEFRVVQIDGVDAGRLYLHRRPEEVRIMDLALLPKFRRLGVGTRLLRGLLDEAARLGAKVSVHVEAFNPAKRLYQRLGFREVSKPHVYLLMEWTPPEVGAGA